MEFTLSNIQRDGIIHAFNGARIPNAFFDEAVSVRNKALGGRDWLEFLATNGTLNPKETSVLDLTDKETKALLALIDTANEQQVVSGLAGWALRELKKEVVSEMLRAEAREKEAELAKKTAAKEIAANIVKKATAANKAADADAAADAAAAANSANAAERTASLGE